MKNKKKLALISQFEEVNSYMEMNLEKWNGIDEIRRTYDEFVNKLKKIKDIQPELKHDISALKKELDDKRTHLLLKIFPVGNILEVYAEDHPIGKNSYGLVMGQKYIESLNRKDLLDHALSLYKRCDKIVLQYSGTAESLDQISQKKDIRRYGLNRLMLDELYSSAQQFQSSLDLRKDVNTYRKRTRKKMEGYILDNRKLLKNRLNKLMTVFSGTHPSFYNEYRKISSKN